LAGTDGCTTMTWGTRKMLATAARKKDQAREVRHRRWGSARAFFPRSW
jgi:hypothetical protein